MEVQYPGYTNKSARVIQQARSAIVFGNRSKRSMEEPGDKVSRVMNQMLRGMRCQPVAQVAGKLGVYIAPTVNPKSPEVCQPEIFHSQELLRRTLIQTTDLTLETTTGIVTETVYSTPDHLSMIGRD